MRGLLLLFSLGLFLVSGVTLRAAAITVTASQNWSALNPLPTSADTVTVQNGATLTVDITNAACSSVTLGLAGGSNNGDGTLTFLNATSTLTCSNITLGASPRSGTLTMANGGKLQISGLVTLTTGYYMVTAGTGTIEYNGPAQTIPALTYNQLTLSGSGTKVLPSGTIITGNLSLSGTVRSATSANQGVGGLSVGTGTILTNGFNLTVTNAATVAGTFLISSATATNLFADLAVSAGAAWNNTGNGPVTVSGNLTNSGSFSAGTGTHTLTGTGKIIAGTLSISNLVVSGTYTNTGSLTVGTDLAGTGTLTQQTNATLYIAGTAGITGLAAAAGGNTVVYIGSAQTVKAVTYQHLVLSGSGAKTLTGLSTITGNLTLSGTATATTAASMTVGGNLSVGDGTSFSADAFSLAVAGSAVVGGGASGTLNISSATGTKTFADLQVNAGATWNNSGNAPVNISGNLTNGGTFTAGSGTYTLSGSGKSVAGTLAIPSLVVAGSYTNAGTLTVSTALSGAGALAQSPNGTLNLSGTVSLASLGATASGNTVSYNGSAQTVLPVPYYHLALSTSGVKTMTGVTNIGGNLSLSGSATLAGNGSFTVGGALNYASTGASTLSAATPITVGSLNQSAGTLADNGNTITVTGSGANTWVKSGGTFTTTGTVVFTGAAPQIGAFDFRGLTIDVGANNTAALAGAVTVATTATLSLSSGTLSNSTQSLTLGNGATIARRTGSLSASPVFGSSVNVSYIGSNGVTANNELPVSSTVLSNLTVNNSGGVTLVSSPTVNGTLTLSNGQVVTGTNRLNLTAGATATRASGWVNGTLQKAFATGSGQAFTFPIGGAVSYRPVALASLAVTNPGTISASVTAIAGNHPAIATSGLDASATVTHYWTVTAGNGLGVTNYNSTFNFDPSDVPSGANPSYFVVRKYSGGTWYVPTAGPVTATSATALNLSSFSDFVVGQIQPVALVVTLPGQTFTNGIGSVGSPAARTAGTPFGVTLTAVSLFTNLVDSYAGIKTITFSGPAVSPGGVAPVYTTDVTFANGQATNVSVTLYKAETTTLAATDGVLTNVAPSAVAVNPAPVNAGVSTVWSSSSAVIADGVSTATVNVNLKDNYGNPVAGKGVSLTKTAGAGSPTIVTTQGITDAAGLASFAVKSTMVATNTFTATDSTDNLALTQTATVAFTVGPVSATASTMSASPTNLVADGVQTSTITVTLYDAYSHPVPGKSVTVAMLSGYNIPILTTVQGTTDSSGQALFTVKSTAAGTDVFRAIEGTDNIELTQRASVSFTAGALDHYELTFSASALYVKVPFLTYATAKDAYGNTVATNNGTLVLFSSTNSAIQWCSDGNNSWGATGSREAQVYTTNGIAVIDTWANSAARLAAVTLTATSTSPAASGTSAPVNFEMQADSYRTRASGPWASVDTWEVYAGTNEFGQDIYTNALSGPDFNNGVITIRSNHTVTVAADLTVNQVHIEPQGQVTVASGTTFQVVDSTPPGLEVYGTLLNNGTVTISNDTEIVVYGGGFLINGGVVNSGGASGLLKFTGGTYQHSQEGGVIPSAQWYGSSTCEVIGYTNSSAAPAGLGQAFRTFSWNSTNQSSAVTLRGFTNASTFTLKSTGSGRIALGANLVATTETGVYNGATLYCDGYVITGGAFILRAGGTLGIGSAYGITTNAASPTAGNIQTASTRNFSSSAAYVYNGLVAQVTGNALPANLLSLSIANPNGVTLNGDVTGQALSIGTGDSLALDGHTVAVEQDLRNQGSVAGAGRVLLQGDNLATLSGSGTFNANLELDTPSGWTVSDSPTLNTTLTLTRGTLGGAANVYLGNGMTIVRAAGSLDAAPLFAESVDVSYVGGAAVTAGYELPADANVLYNLTLAYSSPAALTLSADRRVNGSLGIGASSALADGGYTLTVKGGVVNAGAHSGPGKILLAGDAIQGLSGLGSFGNLDLNNPSGAVVTDGPTVTGTLTLSSGTLGSATNLNLASGAAIARAVGSLDAPPVFGTNISVSYIGSFGVTAGYELPAATNVLHDLTLAYSVPAVLTLSAPQRVHHFLTIGANSTLADGGFVLTVVGDVYNYGVHSGTGKLVLDNPAEQTLFGSGTYQNLELFQGDLQLAGDPTINGQLTLTDGRLSVGSHTLTLNGPNITGANTNLDTSAQSSLVFGGNYPGIEVPATVALLDNLTVNNANGVSLKSVVFTYGTLVLANGTINTGTNRLCVYNTNNVTCIQRGSGWVNGSMCKLFDAGDGQSFTYPLGGPSLYRPLVWSTLDVMSGGELEVQMLEGVPDHIESSGFNANKLVQVYWRAIAKGRLQLAPNTTATFNFAPADRPEGVDSNRLFLRVWDETSQAWYPLITTGRTATNTTASDLETTVAVSDSRYEAGNFVLGQPLASQLVGTLPGEAFEDGAGNAGTPDTQTAGVAFNLVLSAVDSFNTLDTSFSGWETVSYSGPAVSPSGAAPQYSASVLFTNGQALAATTLTKAETTTVTAGGQTLPGVPGSRLTVGPGAHHAYGLSAAKTVLGPGEALPLAITAVDAFGNLVPGVTAGDHWLTFSGLATSGDGSHPARVTDNTGVAQALGQATAIAFADGQSAAGGVVTAYRAQTATLHVSDGTNSSSSAGGGGLQVTVTNVAPVASAYAITRAPNTTAKVAKSAVVAVASDANYDALSISAASPSNPQASTVAVSANYIYYTPAAGNNQDDAINYTLSDGNGGTAPGTVSVSVVAQPGVPQAITAVSGMATVRFFGIPSLQYDVLRTTNLVQPVWQKVNDLPLQPSADGSFTYSETLVEGGAYYRSIQHY